jgi:hypothetical protein
MVRFALALLLVTASVARAEPPTDSADPDTAARLSIIGSAFPVVAIGIGTLVGFEGTSAPIRDVGAALAVGGALAGVVTPSIGNMYGHRWLSPGMAMRAGGLVVEYIGLLKGFNTDIGDCADPGPCHRSASTFGLLAGGAALYLGGMALDIVGAPQAAREWNARHEVRLVPTAIKTPSSTGTGLVLALTF